MNKIQNRILCYFFVAIGLTVSYFFLRDVSWQGSAQLHTLMESVATFLALMVGSMALARYYSDKDDTSLIIGAGFLGTGFLDAYHGVVTSVWFLGFLPSNLPTLSPWSWIAPRLFLAVVLYYSYWVWQAEKTASKKHSLNPKLIYAVMAFFTFACFVFFAFSPLPTAYYPNIPFHRPQELLPAFFFALALIGYLRKGAWRDNSLDHWLVLSLIVNLISQTVFMSFSSQIFDMEFDIAHLLKKTSYLCVLVGLFIAMFDSFKQVKQDTNKIETALSNTEERYHAVIENILEGIITINELGLITTMNPAAEKTFAYDKIEVIGQNIKMLMPEPYHSEHDGYLHNYVTTDIKKIIGIEREVKGQRKNGEIFPIALSVSEIQFDNQRTFIGLVRDITDLKQSEKVMSQFSAIIEFSDDAIMSKTLEGIITSWNSAASKIFGYSPQEAIGQSMNIIIPPDRVKEEPRILEKIARGESIKHFDTIRQTKDGKLIDISVSISPIKDKTGKVIGISKIARDISERKKIDVMKNEFISTVSHELRTPLTSIQGALELILSGVMGNLPEECIPLLAIAKNNSSRLVRLINDILDIEKIESGKMEFCVKPIEIIAVVQQAIAANQSYADDYGVKLVLTSQIDNVYVLADSDRLIQVLTNLLSNAAKFSVRGDPVEIGVATVKNSVRIAVTDYGSGIPDDFKTRIFSKFSQADGSSSKQQGGTGLGLSISKAIIEKLGGTIDYVSEPQIKTCFYAELPIYRQETSPVSLQPEPEKGAILICEDDPDIANLLKLMLEKNGHSADIAFSAEQAKLMLLDKHYAAMTLDLMLPGQSGVDFFKELRQTEVGAELPIVVISAIADQGRAELNGSALSVYDWLGKPIDQQRLERVIKRILENKSNNIVRILHVEDDPDIVTLVKSLFKNQAIVDVATNLETAKIMLRQQYDLIILDLVFPDGSGKSLLATIAYRDPPIPVVVFSAQENIEEFRNSVSAFLVKSKTTNKELIHSIELILKQKLNPIKEDKDV